MMVNKINSKTLNAFREGDHRSLEDEIVSKEVSLLVEMFVSQMPVQRKEIYNLSRKEGLNSQQIARRLNTTERNVEIQLDQALKTLREAVI